MKEVVAKLRKKKASSPQEQENINNAIAMIEHGNRIHAVWHKFSNFIANAYGKDLYGPWQVNKIKNKETGKTHTMRYRSFNEYELSTRLVGYEVMCRVKKWVNRYCPEIRMVHCDDSCHAGSDILLIPHPEHGITVIFIPQCTGIQNQFFLYEGHYKMLMKELKEMGKIYKPVK